MQLLSNALRVLVWCYSILYLHSYWLVTVWKVCIPACFGPCFLL